VIDRSKPLTFNWTGSGIEQVAILASTATMVGANVHIATISCYVPAGSVLTRFRPGHSPICNRPPRPAPALHSVGASAIGAGDFCGAPVGGGQTDIGAFGANLGVDKNIAVQ